MPKPLDGSYKVRFELLEEIILKILESRVVKSKQTKMYIAAIKTMRGLQ